jgi:hypothetical protein
MIIDKANDGSLSGTYCHLGFPHPTNKFKFTGSYDQTGSQSGGTIAWYVRQVNLQYYPQPY